ncbi:hypothetical protein [Thermophagus xiamenensis]|uniref:Uncharacterized protein n=2 Tax=Thermophagus xiamenensis TaxID=385682 RepID=A0A1I1VSG2_9BACT|nr:hypothetical protein [Thermophagus xiamenensis]SFD85987.1 hypothetical protein SAMN05444380_10349 [Thermophagus xiamenensis]
MNILGPTLILLNAQEIKREMKNPLFILVISLLPFGLTGQTIEKPRGCFAGTNGTHPDVLSHPEARGVLLIEKWSNLETSPLCLGEPIFLN